MGDCSSRRCESQGDGETDEVDIADIGVKLRVVIGELTEVPRKVVVWVGGVANGGLDKARSTASWIE